ncbi:MAG TPA: zf-HC2 domain-containing protein [Capillibacterium sp.]
MNCHRVQSLLSAYLDQELSPEEQRLVRNHIFHCPACAENYEDLSHIKSYLGNLEPPIDQRDLDLLDRFLFDHLHAASSFTANPWHPLLWWKRLALTGACVLLFLLTAFYLFPVEQTSPMTLTPDTAPFSVSSGPPYQPVIEVKAKADVNFLAEDGKEKEEEEKKRENEHYFWREQSHLVKGVPVSR